MLISVDMAVLINEYNDALARSAELAKEKFKRIKTLVKKLGLDKDLLLKEVNEEAVEEIEHYLMDLGRLMCLTACIPLVFHQKERRWKNSAN